MCTVDSRPANRCYDREMKRKQIGFTLIEVLVVLAVISILASVLYVNFGAAREDVRNQSFQAELKEMQLALELYKAQFGRYPEAHNGGGAPGACNNAEEASSRNCVFNFGAVTYPYILGLEPDFTPELLTHEASPNPNCNVEYKTDTDGTWYKLTGINCIAGAADHTEGIQPDSEFARCPSSCADCAGDTYNTTYEETAPFYESVAVYSNGGQCE